MIAELGRHRIQSLGDDGQVHVLGQGETVEHVEGPKDVQRGKCREQHDAESLRNGTLAAGSRSILSDNQRSSGQQAEGFGG